MSTDYDPDETLAAYGYGSKPGKGKTIAIVLLTLLIGLVIPSPKH